MAPPAHPPAILLMAPRPAARLQSRRDWRRRCPAKSSASIRHWSTRTWTIGTAKPDADTLRRAPHHLINLIEPHESYSAARFRDGRADRDARDHERGNIPLLVGGTMLYFKALVEGLNDLPEADSTIRLIIETMAERRRLAGRTRKAAQGRSGNRGPA